MTHTSPAVLYILIPLFLLAPSATASDPKVQTLPTESATIFLAEIEAAQPGDGCPKLWSGFRTTCNTKVQARILRVYKSAVEKDPGPSEFNCEIHQEHVMSGTTRWQTHEEPIRTGQRFLIFSKQQGYLPAIFATTPAPIFVSDDADIIGDLELVLNTEILTLGQQASAAAVAIADTAKPRSLIMGQYVGKLLAAGSDAETAGLVKAVESSPEQAFSLRGRLELLRTLSYESKSGTTGPDNLVHAFVVTTARYFLLEPNQATPLVPDMHDMTLYGIQFILEHDRPRSMWANALTPSLRQRVAKKVAESAADKQMAPTRREQLQQVLTLMRAQ
jgi:hypothetical protein